MNKKRQEMKKLTPSDFVATYLPFARQTEEKTGINARFILAQAALESGWGNAAPGNMFFGVKANPETTPEARRQLLTTKEVLPHANATFPKTISVTSLSTGKYLYVVKDWFRKYESPEESFTDHARLFVTAKRYAKAMEKKADPYAFAEEVAKAGYATAPDYARILKSVIRTIDKYL